jgi:NIMA (never in mitosis gene a)-related kinase
MSFHIEIMKKNNQHFSENLVINWVLQLVLGVQFIHSKKILHRDLKPQNIFIDNDMNIKIGDFGISKILATTSEQCKTMIGKILTIKVLPITWRLKYVLRTNTRLRRIFGVWDA